MPIQTGFKFVKIHAHHEGCIDFQHLCSKICQYMTNLQN